MPAIFFNAFFRNRITKVTMDVGHIADDLLTQMYHNSKKPAHAGRRPRPPRPSRRRPERRPRPQPRPAARRLGRVGRTCEAREAHRSV